MKTDIRGGLGIIPLVVVAAVLSLGAVAAGALAQGSSKCKAADSYTASILPYLDSLATRGDSVFVSMRTKLQLVQTTSQNVAVVTHKNTCANAARAIDSVRNTPNSGRSVYVFKLGTRYGVSDPGSPSLRLETGSRLMVMFTSAFGYLSTLTH